MCFGHDAATHSVNKQQDYNSRVQLPSRNVLVFPICLGKNLHLIGHYDNNGHLMVIMTILTYLLISTKHKMQLRRLGVSSSRLLILNQSVRLTKIMTSTFVALDKKSQGNTKVVGTHHLGTKNATVQ